MNPFALLPTVGKALYNIAVDTSKGGHDVRGVNLTKNAGTGLPFVDFNSNNNAAPAPNVPGQVPSIQEKPRAETLGSGVYTGGGADGAGGAGSDDALTLAQLADQEQLLRSFLGSDVDTQLNQGITQLQDDFNKQQSMANQDRSRTLSGYETKRTDTTQAKEQALNRVGDHARQLRNTVMQQIGRASGSGSSAYQLAAPGAINRDASLERTDVTDNYGKNFRDLKTAEDDASLQYDRLNMNLNDQYKQKTGQFRTGVEQQKSDAYGSLADIARQRAAIQGGGPDAIRAASAPYQANIDSRKATIDSLFNQYRTPYQVQAVNAQAPSLRDYTTDRSAVNAGAQAGTPADSTSPYAQFLKPNQDEEEKLF